MSIWYLNRCPAKRTCWHVHPSKFQISLRICEIWSEPSIDAIWVAKVSSFIQGDNYVWLNSIDAQSALNIRWTYIQNLQMGRSRRFHQEKRGDDNIFKSSTYYRKGLYDPLSKGVYTSISKENGQELIQSSASPDHGQLMEKVIKQKNKAHTREPRGQPFPSSHLWLPRGRGLELLSPPLAPLICFLMLVTCLFTVLPSIQ